MPETRQVIERRWQAFVDEYIKDFDGRRAVEECGCYKAKGKVANVRAAQLLTNAKVQELIKQSIEARNVRTHIDQDRIILELARVGLFRLDTAAQWNDNDFNLKASKDLTDDEAAAISEVGVEIVEYENEHGITRRIKRRIKTHDKLAALDKLARHVGLYEADNKRVIEFGVVELPANEDTETWAESVQREMNHASSNGKAERHLEG